MINESVPVEAFGRYGPIVQVLGGIGYALVLGLGLGLPESDYVPSLPREGENLQAYEADRADVFWRFIYAFPLLINSLMLLSFKFNIDADPIMYCLRHGDEDQAMKLIERVYVLKDEYDRQQCLDMLKKRIHK